MATGPKTPPPGSPAGGARQARPGPVAVPTATTVAPSDTSTSTVIHPTGPQIQCGTTPLISYDNVIFATPGTGTGTIPLSMDIRVPETPGKKPLVVYMPGGGFVISDPTTNLDQRTYLAEQGYVVASIQYRTLRNGATYRDSVADVKSAIRYLRAHAGKYDFNSDKVAVWGQSAGGYLAAMAGVTNAEKRFDAGDNLDQSSAVRAVVDQFGPSNLSRAAADFDAATQRKLDAPGSPLAAYVYGSGTVESIASYTPQVAAANPASYVDSSTPPFLLLQGSNDRMVSPSQTLLMLDALREKGVESTRYVLDGAGHGDLRFLGDHTAGLPWSTREVMDIIADFLHTHLVG